MPRRRLTCLLLTLATAAAMPAAGADACPSLAGHYRVAGFGPALGDALAALQAPMAGFTGSEVRFDAAPGGGIAISIKSGSTGTMPAQPSRVLVRGVDFDCRDNAVVLRHAVGASRKLDQAHLEGRSTVRLGPGVRGGLHFSVSFSGGERSTLYSYDSARISVPRPLTGRTLEESVLWPDISEPAPPLALPPAPEPQAVQDTRRLLQPLLGGVTLAGVHAQGDGVRVTLKAHDARQAAQLEQRLLAAGVPFEMKVPPVWSDRGYHLELRVRPGAPRTQGVPARPSSSLVRHELDTRMQYSLVHATRVDDDGDAYIATLDLLGGATSESAIQRLMVNSTLFGHVRVLDETPDPARPSVRVARWRLLLRPW